MRAEGIEAKRAGELIALGAERVIRNAKLIADRAIRTGRRSSAGLLIRAIERDFAAEGGDLAGTVTKQRRAVRREADAKRRADAQADADRQAEEQAASAEMTARAKTALAALSEADLADLAEAVATDAGDFGRDWARRRGRSIDANAIVQPGLLRKMALGILISRLITEDQPENPPDDKPGEEAVE